MALLYKNNPNLGLQTVTTVNNEIEYRRNCKYIKSIYYRIGEDCFPILNPEKGRIVYYRKDNKNIIFDHENKEWLLKKNSNLLSGVVNIKNGQEEFGYFKENKLNNCILNLNQGKAIVINGNLLDNKDYIEHVGSGTFYKKSEHSTENLRGLEKIRTDRDFHNRGYNIEDNRDFNTKVELYKNYNPKPSKELQIFAKYLNNITFGIELETSTSGAIPEYLQYRAGLVACRDGSIGERGCEWVSIPLKGAKGLETIRNISQTLKQRTETDINCSFHVHIGNIPKDRTFLTSLYLLSYKLQNDIFKMFPYFKEHPEGIKRKNYCQKLPKMHIHPLKIKGKEAFKEYIDDVYSKIFYFLSDGNLPGDENNRNRQQHPVAMKWNRPSR